jgi:hypothetical protein
MKFVHLIILFQTIYESNQTVRIFNESNFKQWFEFETAYLFQIKLVRNRFQIKLKHKSVHSCSIRLQPYIQQNDFRKAGLTIFELGGDRPPKIVLDQLI